MTKGEWSAIEPGTLISADVRLASPLAEGAMGSIWKADHLRLGVPVAVKFMNAALVREAPELVERFEREAKAVAQIESEYVVKILDFGVTDRGIPYMAMELLQGETLTTLLVRAHRLGLRDTVRLVAHIASALDAAHAVGIVHRDVKPDNIFLRDTEKLHAKLVDFGVAKHTLASKRLTFHGVMVGTPHYMSPEQIADATKVDHRTDLWALGVVAFEALTGVLPFGGTTLGEVTDAVRAGTYRPVSESLPGGSEGLDIWFTHAFAKNIEERFQSGRELAAALYAVTDGLDADETAELTALTATDDEDTEDELSRRDTFPEIVTQVPTVAPPPSTASIVERVLRRVKDALRKR